MKPKQSTLQAQRFALGSLYLTEGIQELLTHEQVRAVLYRHGAGDWGDLDLEDREANERALEDGSRVLSRYHAADGRAFWVLTEGDRSATTVLLPEEY